ncbi:MAG: cobyrinate a,c-diamide synthase [Bacteroidaceae bacterium]|nr:cobyrinate a,c-diamide synthase [Bacteroidaceae bacterium]
MSNTEPLARRSQPASSSFETGAKEQSSRKISFLLAATNSGCGKTTLTIGILRALQRKGIAVQPFKCGPDYIDTQYHRMASGVESVNLDARFTTAEHLREVFSHYSRNVNVVEGVMGLFDGYDRHHGSSSEIASILGIPIIIIINARSMAYSAAAIIHGFKTLRTDIHIAGVIFNQVGSERHASFLRQACEDTQTLCLGCMPRIPEMEIPSRHLGLSLENEQHIESLIQLAADAVEKHLDWELMIKNDFSFGYQPDVFPSPSGEPDGIASRSTPHAPHSISIARDSAFNFIYLENIDRLKALGPVTFFSPLTDKQLPPSTHLLYLPGGYPEFFLPQLSSNHSMLESIRNFIENGGRCLAECGGMMYLCSNIVGMDGKTYPMVNILHQTATLQDMKLHLGYREWKGTTSDGSPYFFYGHVFHYSHIVEEEPDSHPSHPPIYIYKNLRASYIHIYWGDNDLLQLWQ